MVWKDSNKAQTISLQWIPRRVYGVLRTVSRPKIKKDRQAVGREDRRGQKERKMFGVIFQKISHPQNYFLTFSLTPSTVFCTSPRMYCEHGLLLPTHRIPRFWKVNMALETRSAFCCWVYRASAHSQPGHRGAERGIGARKTIKTYHLGGHKGSKTKGPEKGSLGNWAFSLAGERFPWELSLLFGWYEGNSTVFSKISPISSPPFLYQRITADVSPWGEFALERAQFLAQPHNILPKMIILIESFF